MFVRANSFHRLCRTSANAFSRVGINNRLHSFSKIPSIRTLSSDGVNGASSVSIAGYWKYLVVGFGTITTCAAFHSPWRYTTVVDCQKKPDAEDDKVIREYLTKKFSITHAPLVWLDKINGITDHYIEFRVNGDLVKLQYPEEVKLGLVSHLRGISHPKLSLEVIHQARHTDSGVIFRFQKKGEKFTKDEIENIGKVINMMQRDEAEMVQGFGNSANDAKTQTQEHLANAPPKNKVIEELEQLGAVVYQEKEINWETLAGCDKIKAEVEDHILLALKHPEVFEQISKGTRKYPKSNLPRAIMFTGPPGTGKTSTARIIASQTSVPMVYIPLESVVSKYYGEAEKKLGQIFDACGDLQGSIVFIDEIDSLATSRGGEIHEASRRTLSVLLRRIDGFQDNKNTLVIGATNRPQDLDEALLSRFDTTLHFPLPDSKARSEIFSVYAIHLNEAQRQQLGEKTEGLSGRNIKDICQQTERRWAAALIREGKVGKTESYSTKNSKGNGTQNPSLPLPPFHEYLAIAESVKLQQDTLMDEVDSLRRRSGR